MSKAEEATNGEVAGDFAPVWIFPEEVRDMFPKSLDAPPYSRKEASRKSPKSNETKAKRENEDILNRG